jgi:hypothetical protein
MLLLGKFADDISMYTTRNPKFNLMTLISTILSQESLSTKKVNLRNLLAGRMFATCTQICDMVNQHDASSCVFMNKVLISCFESL